LTAPSTTDKLSGTLMNRSFSAFAFHGFYFAEVCSRL